ncbi:MAG: DUF2073 domain-containing protein [Methanomicrobiales archaeon]|nr:DUF2073 domain-containing protein [Methanomicrobiales archaeon]
MLQGVQGVQIDLISEDRMARLTSMEKIRLILDDVKEGNIVVLEKGLAPEEASKLIELTMMEIKPDGFTGIEMETYPDQESMGGFSSFFTRLIGRKARSRLTVIGPANQLKMIKKEKDLISAWVSSR